MPTWFLAPIADLKLPAQAPLSPPTHCTVVANMEELEDQRKVVFAGLVLGLKNRPSHADSIRSKLRQRRLCIWYPLSSSINQSRLLGRLVFYRLENFIIRTTFESKRLRGLGLFSAYI
jgi:hypothetical protein